MKKYQALLDNILTNIEQENITPTLLLHSCCAPCSSYTLEYLSKYFKITILYYNPNIYPHEEFIKRQNEQKEFIKKLKTKNPVNLIETNYEPKIFYDMARGLENLKEGDIRCYKCYLLRMEEAALVAKQKGFDYFTTTLSISPYKNATWINEIGEVLEQKYQVKYLYTDLKKKNGYKRSIELSHEYNLYRQDYCGCIYSKVEHDKRVSEN